MSEIYETLLTSDKSSNLWTAALWDYNSGTCLHYYRKGSLLNSNGFTFIGNDYFLAAESTKPIINVWSVNSQETLKNTKIVCSGIVSSLTASPDGNYCAGAINEQLHIWQTKSGQLLRVASKHFQPITRICFTSDGSFIVTSGEDGLLIVWALNRLLTHEQSDPLHVISDHSLPIKDIYVGRSPNGNTRVMSVSADCTLKIHELASGQLLLTVVFDKMPTALVSDVTEKLVFVGMNDGNIKEVNLFNPPRNNLRHMEDDKNLIFKGHTSTVTTLSISIDGLVLASGSQDNQVILWHIPSKQKQRVIRHNGPVTNVKFLTGLSNVFRSDFKPSFIFKIFFRSLTNDSNQSIDIMHREDISLPFYEEKFNEDSRNNKNIDSLNNLDNRNDDINKLKSINHQLYEFCLNMIVNQAKDKDEDVMDFELNSEQVDELCKDWNNSSMNGSAKKRKRKRTKINDSN